MAHRPLRILLLTGMGLAAAACGAAVATHHASSTSDPATAPVVQEAAPQKPVIVDVDRPWMQWGDARPDPGRVRIRSDPTSFWTDARALQDKAPTIASTTPATREAIPLPVEPGSTVGSLETVPEPPEILKPAPGK